MVRSAYYRKAKYEAKIDGDVVRSRILAQKPIMVEQMETRVAQAEAIEQQIKAIVENQETPVTPIMLGFYHDVGRELGRLARKFSGTTFAKAAQIACDKWKAQGLSQSILGQIAALFGVEYPPSP